MTRKPEEIKKGLRHCSEDGCKGCNYKEDCDMADGFSVLAFDAFALIQQLEAQVAKDINVPSWISVYTQMPKYGQHVLAVNGDGVMEVLYYDDEWPNAFCGCGGLLKVYNITHWMPLPEGPKEG